MPRVKGGPRERRRHKKVLKQTKGHHGVRHRLIRRAAESRLHALSYAYAHRRERKGDMRRLWITRINAAARMHDISYSRSHQRPQARRNRHRPQGPGRDGAPRSGRLRRRRRTGQGGLSTERAATRAAPTGAVEVHTIDLTAEQRIRVGATLVVALPRSPSRTRQSQRRGSHTRCLSGGGPGIPPNRDSCGSHARSRAGAGQGVSPAPPPQTDAASCGWPVASASAAAGSSSGR